MINGDHILGVSVYLFFMIIIFWMVVAELVFGPGSFEKSPVDIIILFFTLGSTFLIGHFGWQILIFPSVVIIGVAGYLIWNRFN